PWLHAQCGSDWILNLDDDEVPSGALLAHLQELLGVDVTHWWLPRRWLVGDVGMFLDEPPWVPDYQLRLYRNDPATLRFLDEADLRVIREGLGEPAPPSRAHRGSIRRASREEIDAHWPGEPFDPSLWSGSLSRLDTLERLPVRAQHTITVAVVNGSRVVWRRGPDAAPLVQVGTRWLTEGGSLAEHGPHTPLPA